MFKEKNNKNSNLLISRSTQFHHKIRLFCIIFYEPNMIIDDFEDDDNIELVLEKLLDDFLIIRNKYFDDRPDIIDSKKNKKYADYIKSRRRTVKNWIYHDPYKYKQKRLYFNSTNFSKDFEYTNFYSRYSQFFDDDFNVNSFLNDNELNYTSFTSHVHTIKQNFLSSNDIDKKFTNFSYVTLYSTRDNKLIKYKIIYTSGNKIALKRIGKEERYTGHIKYSNNNFIIRVLNDKIDITSFFLLNNNNSFDNDAVVGITIGGSLKNSNVNLLSRKVILSKYETVNKEKKVEKLLHLFLNKQQFLEIYDDDVNNLNSIVKYGKTDITYINLLNSIKNQMSESKKLFKDDSYINYTKEDSFFIPLIENYNTLEGIFSRLSIEKPLTYRIRMNMVDVFKCITSNKKAFNSLKESEDDFFIEMCFDLTKYKHNVFFNSKGSFKRVFKNVEDLILKDKLRITFIVEDIKFIEYRYQINFIPDILYDNIYIISKVDIIDKNLGIDPLNNITTVFTNFANQLIISKPDSQEFIYSSVDRGKRGIDEVMYSFDVLCEYSHQLTSSHIQNLLIE